MRNSTVRALESRLTAVGFQGLAGFEAGREEWQGGDGAAVFTLALLGVVSFG